jgi:hypothetical protein
VEHDYDEQKLRHTLDYHRARRRLDRVVHGLRQFRIVGDAKPDTFAVANTDANAYSDPDPDPDAHSGANGRVAIAQPDIGRRRNVVSSHHHVVGRGAGR